MAAVRFCQICKKQLNAERADAIPETRLCSEHAKAIRKFGGEFVLISTQETISKQGSLKKNYGGVSTTQQRNLEALDRLLEEHEAATEADS